jgi:hypothetical protein
MSRLYTTAACLAAALTLAACTAAPLGLAGDAAPPGAATAVILLPEELELVSINGREIEGAGGLLSKGDKTYEVVPGRYELLVFYRELWERGDHHDVLRSDPALFTVQAEAGARYRLAYERPGTFAEAEALAADFAGWAEDLSTGVRTPSRASGLKFRRGLIPAVTFDDALVPSAASGGGGQFVPPLEGAAEEAPPAQAPTASAAPDPDWLALMKSWWNQASDDERREFLRWLGEQR